ncbi:hypothetical protein WN51_06727 [Melipona quadrifasciata]|uniref:Uncharacterized protein n=1 Tax=Melipona quadrifasciata TaxID=166423 RepID=A0A0M8ZSC7_9HYME|nr:hypothetical protein WN51_06727 [Melipona quadrifasciata]
MANTRDLAAPAASVRTAATKPRKNIKRCAGREHFSAGVIHLPGMERRDYPEFQTSEIPYLMVTQFRSGIIFLD